MSRTVKVLSIDGGGIRGIIPAIILAEIERCTGSPVAEMFDLIAGTSTGGLIALALARPGHDGRPLYRAADLISLYETEGPRIFSRPLLHRIRSVGNLLGNKYPPGPLERVLEDYLGDAELRDALTSLLVTAYEIERRDPVFFKSRKAVTEPSRNFLMRDVARATSAAPTYFAPVRINPVGADASLALIDGGVYATNPAMSAFVEVQRHFPDATDVLVLSLGTGELTRPIPYERARRWGVVRWAQPILDVVFDGVNRTVDYHMRGLFPVRPELGPRYYRFQTELVAGSDDLDDASPENLATLKRVAEDMIVRERKAIDALCAQLMGGDARAAVNG